MTLSVEVRGWDKIKSALDELAQAEFLQLIAKGVGEEVKSEAMTYPTKKHVPLSSVGGFVSDKQRKWFFAALRSGDIQVPYRRTRNLGNRWNVKAQGGGKAVVGNPTPYAPFVHSEGQQSAMMAAIGWRTTGEIVDDVEQSGAAQKVADRVVGKILGMLGLK